MKKSKQSSYIIVFFVCIIVLFAILAGVYVIKNRNNDFPDEPETPGESETVDESSTDDVVDNSFRIITTTEEGEWVIVETTYGSFKYPFAFSDLIAVDGFEVDGGAKLCFYMNSEEVRVPVFSINYNFDEGFRCGTLKLEDAEEIPVTVVFDEFPPDMAEEWQTAFFAAQETFNDVLFSMAENSNFTLVE